MESMTKPMQLFDERKGSKLMDTEIEPPIVEKKLRNLKLNKAAGMDGIHSNILKTLSEVISLPLCMIFQGRRPGTTMLKCLATGTCLGKTRRATSL